MNYINKFCLAILLFLCACGGEVLDDAQNFVPNESPVITSISFEPSDPTLTNYEEKLGIVERFHNISSKLEKLNALLENTDFDGKDEFYGLIDEISKEI